MTHELGRYWDAPNISEIEVDEESALMSESAFRKLKNYSSSIPSGVYEGKMWKCETKDGWYLRWYQNIPNNDKDCAILSRKIILI